MKRYVVYIVIIFALLLIPSGGLLVFGPSNSTNSEKRDLAELPDLMNADGTLNLMNLSGFGDWFEDHFAGRTAFVTTNALLKQATLGSVYDDEVIIGKEGHLFYSGTLDDYFRRDPMTDRELFITAHNLKMIQDYSRARGANFVFVLAANKNSLYPQYMPDNYLEGGGETNAQALIPWLKEAGVLYVDMHKVLESSGEVYYRRDSHWTQEGALIGYEAIMQALDLPSFTDQESVWNTEQHAGDLEQMLLPDAYTLETAPRRIATWHYDADEEADAQIVNCTNPMGTGTLMMYRDSFGTALVPYLAETFQNSRFTQIWPCIMNDVDTIAANDVILEKVERNLIDLAIRPAIMRPPETAVMSGTYQESDSELALRPEGSLVQIHGSVQADLVADDTLMFISVGEGPEQKTYEAFLSTNSERRGNDCYIYVGRSQLEQQPTKVQLIIGGTEEPLIVCEGTFELEANSDASRPASQEDTEEDQ